MERPVNINLHESLEGVEDRSCLVMDDDGPFVQRLARALAQRGFIVSAVTNVAEGKDIARLNPPAFAVLDLRLEDGRSLRRRKTRCRPTGCAGNTSSACMSCAITMSRKRPGA